MPTHTPTAPTPDTAPALRGRRVLVTGAAGSIGSELCRQLCAAGVQSLVGVDHAEIALYELGEELRGRPRGVHVDAAGRRHGDDAAALADEQVHLLVGDVADRRRMGWILARHRPHVVLHAAAYKHLPFMQRPENAAECVRNNVGGTRAALDLAAEHEARFVLVSTDKAVRPSSVMGLSKRLAELYVRAQAGARNASACVVRFGNVLGSSGSVAHVFARQIAAGGPVTVTHPGMVRYLMSIPEACALTLAAAAEGGRGELYVLDMGEPVRIVDLARDLVTRSGRTDVEIRFTGPQPGEKLVEDLVEPDEPCEPTRVARVRVVKPRPLDARAVVHEVDALLGAGGDPERAAEALWAAAARLGVRAYAPEQPQASSEP